MSKRVLIPTDFSEAAYKALRYALLLFKGKACNFYLLHAYQISGYSVDSPLHPDPSDIAMQSGKMEAETGLSQLLETILADPLSDGHEFETIATYNSLLYAVRSSIVEHDIDMIIMGTKGITGAESLIFGTNAINIMEGITTCPVLSVPASFEQEAPNEIVFPTDFKGQYDRKEFNELIAIAAIHEAPIRVLHIQKEKSLSRLQQANKQLLGSILAQTEHSFHELSDRKVHRGVGVFVNSRESNMITFLNRKHSILDNILSRPMVKELGYHYKIPMLALNEAS